MAVIDIEFQPGGLGLVFDDGTSANGKLEVIGGVLRMVGLTAAQLAQLQAFNTTIDSSVAAYDPRFGSGTGTGIYNVVEDLTPQLGRHLDLNGRRIYEDAGDPRGLNAFDFQLTRAVAAQVAAGAYSFIAGGRNNIITGDGAYAEGDANTASGRYSYAEGSNNEASGRASHAEGYNNQASGSQSHAEGENNIASGDQSHAEGYRTVAAGVASHAEGSYTIASGRASFAGNLSSSAQAEASRATGYASAAYLYAQRAHAAGAFSQVGDAQNTETLARITTTDDSWTELHLDGAAGLHDLIIQDDTFYAMRVTVAGLREGTNQGCMFMRMITIERNGGVTTLLSEETIGADINPGGTDGYFDVRFQAVDDRMSIEVRFDGGTNYNSVRWMAHIDALEILNPATASLSPSISVSMSASPSMSMSPSISHSTSASLSASLSVSPSMSASISPSNSQFSTSISNSPSMSVSPSTSVSSSISISPSLQP